MANNEDKLFIMAGRQTEDEEHVPNTAIKGFPCVMVRKTDGEDMLKIATFLSAFGLNPMFELVVDVTPITLASKFLGSLYYPRVLVSQSVIVVHTSRNWGCVLSSNSGNEWQVFVLPLEDINMITHYPMKSLNGHDMSAGSYFTGKRLDMYAMYLARKCAGEVHNDANREDGSVSSVTAVYGKKRAAI